ncbi:MAG TPA: hypothetical protein DEF42_17115 [Desulfosporosinus sp.]|nr:hypothetical protein [Desulfosporosinus sp.]
MIDVYGLLANIIEPICPCWVGHYPTDQEGEDNKVYPYVEIKFPNILPNNTFSDKNLLEVDIWHNKDTDIREIEAIADSIHKELNFFNVNAETYQLSINRNTPYRLTLPDPNIKIQRRQLRYIVKVYHK